MIFTCVLLFLVKNFVVIISCIFRFYFLSKIYKFNNFGRSIVFVCSCFTENIFVYFDEVLVLFVKSFLIYVKDINYVFYIFDSFRFEIVLLDYYFLFIMDVKLLYTVIFNNFGL